MEQLQCFDLPSADLYHAMIMGGDLAQMMLRSAGDRSKCRNRFILSSKVSKICPLPLKFTSSVTLSSFISGLHEMVKIDPTKILWLLLQGIPAEGIYVCPFSALDLSVDICDILYG